MAKTNWAEMQRRLGGLTEIAEMLGVATTVVANWRTRHADFPAAVLSFACGDLWDLRSVRAWADDRQDGRQVLSQEQWQELLNRRAEGIGVSALARQFGISKQSIYLRLRKQAA